VGCSHGLHAGSLAYARGWAERVILVEIDPADVVSVPGDENCQKLRCCKYTVVGEYNGPLPDTYTPEFSSDQSDDSGNSHDSGTGAGDCCDNCDCSDYDCSDGSCECCDDPNEVSDKCQSCSDCNDSAPDAPISPSVQPDECPICNYDKFACVCSEEKVQSTPQPQVANINNNAHSNLSEIGRRFLEVLAEQLGIEKESISLNQRISDLGVDSLDIIEIAVAVEEVFGLPEISDDAMDSMRGNSIEDIITFLECQLADTPSFTRNSYAAGSEAGINDKLKNLAPAYISGDELGADSEAHRGYILGYIDGYNAVTGC
jgi:acyl carrier protein